MGEGDPVAGTSVARIKTLRPLLKKPKRRPFGNSTAPVMVSRCQAYDPKDKPLKYNERYYIWQTSIGSAVVHLCACRSVTPETFVMQSTLR